MKILRCITIALATAVLISVGAYGCAKKQVVTEGGQVEPVRPSEVPEASKEVPKAEEKPSEVMRETKEAPPGPKEQPEPVEASRAEKALKDVYYAFDSYDLSAESRKTLQENADWINANKGPVITVEGHCDERGSDEYNLALGDRRAKAVKDYLVSLGVPSSKVDTISYGEEKPLCTEQTEECWEQLERVCGGQKVVPPAWRK